MDRLALEGGHRVEGQLEHVGRDVQLPALAQLSAQHRTHPGLDDPAFLVPTFEPRVWEQQVETVDARRPKDAIQVHVEVDVAEREVAQIRPYRPFAIELDEFFPDLEPDHESVGASPRELEGELRLGAAQLHVDRTVDRQVIGCPDPGRPRLDVLPAERVYVLSNSTQEVELYTESLRREVRASARCGGQGPATAPNLVFMAANAPTEDEGRRLGAELAALRDLVSVLAHDLSNPLQSLTVLLELALEEVPSNDPAHGKLDQSLNAAQRMRHLVRDLSEFARSGARRSSPATIGSSVDRCIGVLRRRFERQQIELSIELGQARERELAGPVDARALQSALMNTLLGFVAAAGSSGFAEHRLAILADGDVLELRLEGLGEQGRQALSVPETHRDRVQASAVGAGVHATVEPQRVVIGVERGAGG